MKSSNRTLRSWLLALTAGTAIATTSTVHATEYSWDTNGTTAGLQIGSGNWATTAPNWTEDGGVTRIGWPNTGTDSARIDGTLSADITISLNSADIQLDDITTTPTSKFIYLQQLNTGTRTLTLTGGTYDGTGTTGSQFNIPGGGSLSLAGGAGTTQVFLAGTSDLVKLGGGNLFFGAGSINNTFSGNIYINEGNLFVNSADDTSLGDAGNDIYINDGTLNSNATAGSTYTIGSGRTIHAEASGAKIGSNNANITVQGQITGAGSLTKVNSKDLNLEAACDYAGTTTISAGVLRLQASGTIPDSSDLTINGSGNFNVRNTIGWVYNGAITGDGTGSINPNTGTNATLAGNISGVTGINANTTGTDATVSGNISGTVAVNVQGGAILTLSGDNSGMSGSVTLNGATANTQLNLESATALGTGTLSFGGGTGKIDNTSGGALALSTNNAQAWNNDFNFLGTDNLDLGTGAVTLGGNRTVYVSAKTLAVGGAISGAFGITKASGGTLTLTGTSSYTGNTNINNGKLNISSIKDYGVDSAIGAPASGDIQLGSGNNFSTLSYTGAGDSSDRTVKLGDSTPANTGLGAIQNNGSGALTFTAADFNPTISGITASRTLWLGGDYTGGPNEIQGIIQDNDTGAGGKINVGKANDANTTWLLSGANTYTGSTIVQGGTLKLGASGSIAGSSAVSINAGGILDTSAQASYAIPGAQPVAFGINAAGSGSSGRINAAVLDVSNAVVTYNITGTPDDPVYVLATYTSLSGTPAFASVDAPPTGYTLEYAYEGNKIALVQSAGSPYDTWSGGAPFDGDANGDGVSNGLAWLLGAADKDANATGLLPAVSQSGGNLVLTFNCLKVAGRAGAVLSVQHSSNLGISDPWTSAEVPDADSTVNGVSFDTTDDGDFIDVVATIPSTEAAAGKLFGRLKAENP